ncbi:MAG: hypothetical protein KGD74_03800 [Candidatus Lokiarchaeota archaeon]|nr:hypothetical protein [Candidatus Lokiarchaeota archaeon]
MKIRKYLWILNLIGGILILISILTPTSYNDTTPTLYFVWMTQISVDVEPLAIYLLRTDLMLVAISTILALIIFSSALMAIALTSIYLRASLPFKKLRWKMIVLALLVIVSTLFWIIMMESFYNIYGFNHWIATGGGYTPFFGVIGPFIGAAFIVLGTFVRRE